MSRNIQGILIALLGGLIYSAHDAIIKGLGATLPAIQIAFFAYLLGLPYVIFMLIHDKTPGTLRPANPLWMAIRVVAVMFATVGAFYAFLVLPLAEAYTILFAAPLLVTLLAVPLLGEVLHWRRATAVIVGLVGVLIVLRPDTKTLSIGHVTALASAVGNAMVHISSRRIGGSERLPLMILYPMLGIIVLLGAVMPFTFQPVSGQDFGGLAIVALFSFLAMLCMIEAFKRGEAALIAPMQYSQLIWGTIFGILFFSEYPKGPTLLGAALIIGSGLYIVFREARLKPGAPVTPPIATRRP